MSIYEYDQEKHLRQEREDAWEDGRIEGERAGEKNKLKDDTVKKLKFTMMDRGLKFSTIHSFQGWDAANVIILLQPEGDGNGYTINSSLNKPEVIYTAITRSKQNIVIINNGNTLYHNFFKRNMINEDYTNK